MEVLLEYPDDVRRYGSVILERAHDANVFIGPECLCCAHIHRRQVSAGILGVYELGSVKARRGSHPSDRCVKGRVPPILGVLDGMLYLMQDNVPEIGLVVREGAMTFMHQGFTSPRGGGRDVYAGRVFLPEEVIDSDHEALGSGWIIGTTHSFDAPDLKLCHFRVEGEQLVVDYDVLKLQVPVVEVVHQGLKVHLVALAYPSQHGSFQSRSNVRKTFSKSSSQAGTKRRRVKGRARVRYLEVGMFTTGGIA